jgi:ribonuclease HII
MGTRSLIHLPGVAGIDEAGRGPLAGPVVAAAVHLPAGFDVSGLDDSKKLTPEQREAMAERIRSGASYAIAVADLAAIEGLNILYATMAAMAEAARKLESDPESFLVDGNRVPEGLRGRAEAAVAGDATYACIAAASILAKTERDRMMTAYAERYPEYGFDRHFGYGTPEHLEAIRRHGPCPIHRLTFRPFAAEEQLCLSLDD